MDIIYLAEFYEILSKIQPNANKVGVEDFLAAFAALPPLLGKSQKCAFQAEEFRNDGNQIFAIGNYKDAAIMYTRSIREAPPYSKCAALAYANRSAALYKFKLFKECVLDIDRALDLPYPDDLKPKIISRKEAAVSNMKTATSEKMNNSMPIDDYKFPHGDNAKLPGASHGIDIEYTPQGGRKLIAKMAFQPGDVLAVETPFLPVAEVKEDLAYCHNCFEESLCLIPCDKCTFELYCSEKCKTEAYASHHRIECEIQSTLMSAISIDGDTVFRQELLLQLRCFVTLTEQGTNLNAVFDNVKEIEQNQNPGRLGFTGEQFVGNTGKALLSSLYFRKSAHNPTDIHQTCYIVTLLRNFTNFFKPNADIEAAAKLLVKLRNAQALNCVSIPYFGKNDIKFHGSAPLIRLANHGCETNTITYCDNNGRVLLRALENIKPGDEILYTCSETIYSFNQTIRGNGLLYECRNICARCEKATTYPLQRCIPIKMDKKLRIKLRQNPYDIPGLWKLLNIVYQKHKPHTLQAEVIRIMLLGAYKGRCNRTGVDQLLRILTIQ